MSSVAKSRWVRPAIRIACVALAAVSLAGCVIAPVGYYRPHPYRYYYYPYYY